MFPANNVNTIDRPLGLPPELPSLELPADEQASLVMVLPSIEDVPLPPTLTEDVEDDAANKPSVEYPAKPFDNEPPVSTTTDEVSVPVKAGAGIELPDSMADEVSVPVNAPPRTELPDVIA